RATGTSLAYAKSTPTPVSPSDLHSNDWYCSKFYSLLINLVIPVKTGIWGLAERDIGIEPDELRA
ncbi:hypothetical protein, partial [Pragia fontium]|uniref:hypothetical protein n=1 Tax=Pragia fontium TaxID=82985 RepID=UPI0021C36D8F